MLGELVQQDAARDSRGVRAAGAALCAGLEEAEERVAALGAGGCGGGRGGRGSRLGVRTRRACGMSWWARGLGGCFRNLSGVARCHHCLRRLC